MEPHTFRKVTFSAAHCYERGGFQKGQDWRQLEEVAKGVCDLDGNQWEIEALTLFHRYDRH